MVVSADSLRLSIVEEATPGTTPGTPTWELFRTIGEGLTFSVTTTISDEMGGLNRGVKDNVLTGAEVTGEISFEVSKFKAFEELLASGLGNTWAGDPLGLPGAGADKTYNASDMRAWTIEKRFTLDDTPTYSYHRFTGCTVDTVNMSITPNEIITGSFTFIGNEMTTETAEIAGSTYNQAGTAPIMTAPLVTGMELLSPAGIDDSTGAPLGTQVPWLTNSCFTGLDITLTNNIRGLVCIGTLGNKGTVLGRFEGTATGTLYYNGDEPLDALIDRSEFALRVTMTDDNGDNIQMLFPRVDFANATALATGTNTDVMTEFELAILEYQGDSYAVSTIITRSAPAAAALSAKQTPAKSSTKKTEPAE